MKIYDNVRTHARRAFTLVELLVVISIIALLLAILMPSLGKAREQSRKVVCSSSLHQIMLGVLAYASSNNNRVAAGHDGFGGGYIGTSTVQVRTPILRRGLAVYYYNKYLTDLQVLRCLSDKGVDWNGAKVVGKEYKDWTRRWKSFNFNPDGGSGTGASRSKDVDIISSYNLYTQGWSPGVVGNSGAGYGSKAFQYYPTSHFGAFLVDGPWAPINPNDPRGNNMRSWHGDLSPERGWNVAGIGGEVTFVRRNKISGYFVNNGVWSNLWADNGNIWFIFSEAVGYSKPYPSVPRWR